MDIDSDFDEVAPIKRTTSITVTESDSDDSSHPIASLTSILLPPLSSSELPQTMDPPSPILPPPPGSISPPRFLNEDFEIRDEDDEEERNLPSLPSNLNASELLITPPPPMMDPNLVEESAGEEDDDDEEDEQRRNVPNKVKDSQLHSGLDSLTSDMAAKLQSMISEEIEETIPKDPEVVSEWSSDPVTSPPPPVWRNDVTSVVTVGSVDEEEDESSGNSQSPQQVHKILSPPPPPAVEDDEEEGEEAQDEPEDISRPEKW